MNNPELFNSTISFLIYVSPFVAVAFLSVVLFRLWMIYVTTKFLLAQEYVLLKITPPRDVYKTPVAMELFINGLYQTHGEADWKDIYLKGSCRPWFSLEIASNGGKVAFYIWTRKQAVGFISSQLYAQYPGIEVQETEDYAKKVDYASGKYKLWGVEYYFTESNSVPIKTYVDYGLDKPTEEENRTDPITPTLEFLGSAKPGEYIWLQIIIKAHKKEDKKTGTFFEKTDLWRDGVKDEIKKIKDLYKEKEEKDAPVKMTFNTKVQDERISAIERAQAKLPFDVGIRGLYIAEKEIFDPMNIGGLIGSFKQYSSAILNGFKNGITAKVDYWFQDPFGKKVKLMQKTLFNDYVNRDYFNKDFLGKDRKVLVMNAEELATIFHFPGSDAITPSLDRVQSKKSDAPDNLPI